MNRLSRAARPILLTLAIAIAAPASAQSVVDKVVDARLRKLEAEVTALQRQVFPGGDGKYFPPQTQPAATPTTQAGTPATSALTDVLTRMDSLEGQVQKLTAQQEETSNRIAKLEQIWNSDRGSAQFGANHWAAFNTFTEYMEHEQHIVGKDNAVNRAARALESPGFNQRVHALSKAFRSGRPLRDLAVPGARKS